MRAETRSITIQAPPEDVLRFVADPFNLARWAPGFAPSVHERDERWFIVGDFGEREIVVTASVECGTFDLWLASDPRRGIRTRVIANGDGSEYLFTLLSDDEIEPEALADQLRVVEQELAAVRRLVQDG
jgi:Polyketide cyclase / dehydrase and lipid transport